MNFDPGAFTCNKQKHVFFFGFFGGDGSTFTEKAEVLSFGKIAVHFGCFHIIDSEVYHGDAKNMSNVSEKTCSTYPP